MQNLFGFIDDYSRDYKLCQVTKVVVRIGELSCVSIDALEFAFFALSKGTIAAGAEFIIERVPARSKCLACSHEFAGQLAIEPCPLCGQQAVCVAGRELTLQTIEGTQEENE